MKCYFWECIGVLFLLVGCVSVESPKFETLKVDGDFEVRQYGPTLVAETVVDGNFLSAGNIGFRRLAKYIFGENTVQSKIAMTAPVRQAQASEKIAMTAPVGLAAITNKKPSSGEAAKYMVSFTMPAQYTIDTIPKPIDEAVVLKEIAARKVAVIKFSGGWSESRYYEKLDQLGNWMGEQQLEPLGMPVFARFDPPWTIWFMRHNEIQMQIEPKEK